METIDYSMKVPKECSEISNFLADFLEDILAGKPVAEIISENFQAAMTAIQGYEEIPEELKSEYKASILSHLTDRIGKVLDDKYGQNK